MNRLANWFRLIATNSSMTVPKRKQNQPMVPAVANISGTIRAAVMLGEISAIDWAVTSQKFNALVFSLVWVFLTVTA